MQHVVREGTAWLATQQLTSIASSPSYVLTGLPAY